LAEDLAIQKRDGSGSQVASALGKLAFDQEMMKVGKDLVESELVGRALIVGGQSQDGIDITFDGARGKLPQLHLANHALTKRGHGELLEQKRMALGHAPNERAPAPFWLKPTPQLDAARSSDASLFLRRAV